MNKSDEKRGLLKKCDDCGQNARENENSVGAQRRSVVRFYTTMGVTLVMYIGSMEMASVTMKQFIYAWSLNVTTSDYERGHTNDSLTNSTDACGHKGSAETESEAQKMAANWELYYNLLNAVLVFFSVSIFGTLSDIFGRKKFLLLGLVGCTFKYAIISAVVYLDLHIVWILLAYGVDGLSGSVYLIGLAAYTSSADMTKHSGARIFGIAIIESLLGVGKFSTQFGNGYFIQQYGFFYPMMTATGILGATVLISAITFKETRELYLDKDEVKLKNTRCLTCNEIISRYTQFYRRKGSQSERKIFWLVLVVFVLFELGLQGRSDPLTLFQLDSPFCWSSEFIGYYNAVLAAVNYVIGLLIFKPLQACMSAEVIACIGFVSAVAYNTLTGLATSSLWMFLAIGFGFLMALPKPILRGLASFKTSEKVQGAMFASLQSSELICKIAASPGCLSIYSATLDTMSGFVFLVIAGVNGIAFFFMIWLGRLLRIQRHRPTFVVIQDTE